MATEQSRTFNLAQGTVVSVIKDSYGNSSYHTLYAANVPDVNAAIAQLLLDAEAQAAVIHARMVAAGFTG